MWILLVLFLFSLGTIYADNPTLGFYVESENFPAIRNTDQSRISLQITIPVSQTEILRNFATISAIASDWKSQAILAEDGPLKIQLFNMLSAGESMLIPLKTSLLKMYSYLSDNPSTPITATCVIKISGFNSYSIEESAKQLVVLRTGIALTGNAQEILNNRDLLRKCADFSLTYNNLINDLLNSANEAVANLNLLSEGTFPEMLRNLIDTAECQPTKSPDFEEIQIIGCFKMTALYECEITIIDPTIVINYIRLKPVIYEGVGLKLGTDIFLVKDSVSNKLSFLDCLKPDKSKYFHCLDSLKNPYCLEKLQQGEIDGIILSCNFEYTQGPIAYRLLNDAILVQGQDLSIFEDTLQILQKPPFLIKSNKLVKVISLFEEIAFSPTITFPDPGLQISKLSGLNIGGIKGKATWDNVKNVFKSFDILSYVSLALDFMLAPLTIAGIVMSCKRKFSPKKNVKISKKKGRKNNYSENMEMLERRSRRK